MPVDPEAGNGDTYEAVPAEMIIKAGMLAAAQLILGKPANTYSAPTE